MRNCGWAGVFLCAISGYLFKIAGRVVSSASTAPVPSADWPTRSLCRLASFCTASSPASCALCRNRRWRRQGFVRMFIYVGDFIGGSHGFPGWAVPLAPHRGVPGRLPDVSKSFLVSWRSYRIVLRTFKDVPGSTFKNVRLRQACTQHKCCTAPSRCVACGASSQGFYPGDIYRCAADTRHASLIRSCAVNWNHKSSS